LSKNVGEKGWGEEESYLVLRENYNSPYYISGYKENF
jgi:hypothetical protein